MIGKNVLPLTGLKLVGWEDLPVDSWDSTLNVLESTTRLILIILSVKDVITDGI